MASNFSLLAMTLSAAVSAPSLMSEAKPKNFRPYKNILPSTPTNAKGDLIYGYAAIDLLIDPSGRAIDCRVVSPRKFTEYGRWICTAMVRESRFYPAIDQTGSQVHGVFRYWRSSNEMGIEPKMPDRVDVYIPVRTIPKGQDNPVATVKVEVDSGGKVTFCEISESSRLASLDRIACSAISAQPFGTTFDAGTRIVKTIRTAKIGLKVATE